MEKETLCCIQWGSRNGTAPGLWEAGILVSTYVLPACQVTMRSHLDLSVRVSAGGPGTESKSFAPSSDSPLPLSPFDSVGVLMPSIASQVSAAQQSLHVPWGQACREPWGPAASFPDPRDFLAGPSLV